MKSWYTSQIARNKSLDLPQTRCMCRGAVKHQESGSKKRLGFSYHDVLTKFPGLTHDPYNIYKRSDWLTASLNS